MQDKCWEWPGCRANGYGVTTKGKRVHRILYQMYYGEHDPTLLVRHRCDNPACCNPSHLEIGTHQDNSNDWKKRGGIRKKTKHLSKIEKEEIRNRYDREKSTTMKDLASDFDVCLSTIFNAIHKRGISS